MQKPIFTDRVTTIPGEWANDVSSLVYDVFALARTVADARNRLGLGSLATQQAHQINVTGGRLDGVDIGTSQPGIGRFTAVFATELSPTHPSMLTSRQYVDTAISTAINAIEFRDMARQRSNAVNITGGVAIFDALRSRNAPTLPQDVITLGWLTEVGAGMKQAPSAMTVGVDNQTVITPFTTKTGCMAIFVDGIYQLPDQYEIIATNQIRFLAPIAPESVVGGFCL